jgi:hypothetical protein
MKHSDIVVLLSGNLLTAATLADFSGTGHLSGVLVMDLAPEVKLS